MILKTFKETIARYKLLKDGEKVLIAYSGGVDSTGLLALFLELGGERNLELCLAHFNHKLRQSAEEDERFVRGVAETFAVPLIVGYGDVRFFAGYHKLNVEEAGRKLRYDFLKKTAIEIGATKIATGHTMNDQAETFLMRLMRGSGPRGLGSIFAVVEGIIIRPLIQIERKEIEAFLERRGMVFRIDESNFDRRFVRNRIRLELIPYLQKNFDSRIIPRLGRLASLIQEEDNLLESLAKEKAKKGIVRKNNQIFLEGRFLSSLHPALARRCVRNFISELKGDLRGVSFVDVESALRLTEGKELHLEKDLVLKREAGLIFLKEKSPSKIQYEYSWNGKNSLEIRELGLRFEGKKLKKEDSFPSDFNDESRAYLDWAKLEFPLLVRNRKPGDRYQPLGAPGQKKLKEIMRSKGIPVSQREKHPVFISGEKIVWVVGLPVSEEFKIGRATDKIFLIKKL